jgi:hypothetical protein
MLSRADTATVLLLLLTEVDLPSSTPANMLQGRNVGPSLSAHNDRTRRRHSSSRISFETPLRAADREPAFDSTCLLMPGQYLAHILNCTGVICQFPCPVANCCLRKCKVTLGPTHSATDGFSDLRIVPRQIEFAPVLVFLRSALRRCGKDLEACRLSMNGMHNPSECIIVR